MMAGPIEEDIPIPQGRPLGFLGRLVRELRPGQSRVLESEDLIEAAREAARRAGIAIITRKCKDGWRIWRVV